MPANMTILKSSEYSCLRICNVDDVKVFDWIWLDQNCSFNLNQINTVLRREIKNTPDKSGKSTQLTTKSQTYTKKTKNMWKSLI